MTRNDDANKNPDALYPQAPAEDHMPRPRRIDPPVRDAYQPTSGKISPLRAWQQYFAAREAEHDAWPTGLPGDDDSAAETSIADEDLLTDEDLAWFHEKLPKIIERSNAYWKLKIEEDGLPRVMFDLFCWTLARRLKWKWSIIRSRIELQWRAVRRACSRFCRTR